jgi:pantetheine-phosphate adenylyltransferase
MSKGIVAASLDPITNGHVWLIGQAAKLVDELIVAIGVNPAKKSLFEPDIRRDLAQKALQMGLPERSMAKIEICFIERELLINFALARQATHIFRGIRNVGDFEYESQMRLVNSAICPDIETLFLMPPRELTEVSSSTVKSLLGFEGWREVAQKYVCPPVLDALASVSERR